MDRRVFLTASAASLAAGKRVRAAVLGTGHSHTYGKYKAMLDNPDFEVAGIAEPDAALLAQAKKDSRYAGAKWMTEEQLLSDKSIGLVVVQCAAWDAIPQGRKVIAAGKHLHLEKPPGNDYKAFRALVGDARKKGLKLQTGYLWRFHEGVSAALDAAKKGWLGEVFMVRATMNSDRDQKQRDVEAKYKGGGMFELSGHVIDRVVELLGRPKVVRSWQRHDTSVKDTLADNNLAVFEYEKALAVISQAAKMSGAGDHRSIELIGTDGSMLVYAEANPPTMRVHMRKAQGPYKAGWQEIRLAPQPRFIEDFKELARSILDNRPLRHSYDHELLLQETLLRASGELA